MRAAWLSGIFPPIATAFAADGELRPAHAGYLEFLRLGGLDGVVALGSNGEAANLTESERLQWIRSVRGALPSPLRLIAGTGAESTRATIERTTAAAAEGAEAALVIAPSYFRRQLTAEALRAHYHGVAEASPIPILIYNVPTHMGYDLGAEWIVRLAGHPNIAGIKDSSGDIARLPRLREQLGPDFILLTGAGEKMVDALEAGADGGIVALACLAPHASAAIRNAWLEHRADEARRLQVQWLFRCNGYRVTLTESGGESEIGNNPGRRQRLSARLATAARTRATRPARFRQRLRADGKMRVYEA